MAIVARKARDEYSPKFAQEGVLVLDTSECHVQQHEAADCDINNIMAKYQRTGALDSYRERQPIYGDFSNVPDYREACQIVLDAEDVFMSLPADLRKRFDNDPAEYLNFCSDPNNRDEMLSLGLLLPEQVSAQADAKAPLGDAEDAPKG